MPLRNRFWTYSDGWHVVVNSDAKHTMHNVRMHDLVVCSVGVYCMGVQSEELPGVRVHIYIYIQCFFSGSK
jgi:hypothetical protein